MGLQGCLLGHLAPSRGSSSSEHTCARRAANDASAVQRCIRARCAPAAHHGALWQARALASSRVAVHVQESPASAAFRGERER